jgi:hypothetical protein
VLDHGANRKYSGPEVGFRKFERQGIRNFRDIVPGDFTPVLAKHGNRNLESLGGRKGTWHETLASRPIARTAIKSMLRKRVFPPLKAFVASKRWWIKRALSWLTAAVGLGAGFVGLALAGERWIPDSTTDPYWFKTDIQTAGMGLLGLALVVGSLFALRHRRRGGLIFLICTPLVAFCIGYPDAGHLAWDSYGNGFFYSPFLRTALGLALLFFAPFVVPVCVIRNKKRALYVFLICALAVSPVFLRSQWTSSLVPRLAAWSAPTLVLGLFWVATFQWEPLISHRRISLGKRVAVVSVICLLIAVLDVATTLALTAWQSSPNGPDCGGRPLFTQPVFPTT